MTRKVKLVIFDGDLKATLEKYPVSDSGNHIRVTKGGENHFMPSFDKGSFLDVKRPWWKGGGHERTYFARKLSKSCVNFETEAITGPSPEFVVEMGAKVMLDRLNKQKQEMGWQIWAILAISIFTLLSVMGVIG